MAKRHGVYDTDSHFIIDPITRELTNENSPKTTLIQHDHNSERFSFELPKMIEGHDMMKCNRVQVHYINIDLQTKERSTGIYDVDDLQISPKDSNVAVCSWLISGNATKFRGALHFLLRFACVDSAVVEYAWNTAPHTAISVSEGIYNSEEVVARVEDILEQWRTEIDTVLSSVSSYENRLATCEVRDDVLGMQYEALAGRVHTCEQTIGGVSGYDERLAACEGKTEENEVGIENLEYRVAMCETRAEGSFTLIQTNIEDIVANEEAIRTLGERLEINSRLINEQEARLNAATLPAFGGTITPQQFGAAADGITDDTAAINAAIASLPAEGGTIYFPPGIYRVDRTPGTANAVFVSGKRNITLRLDNAATIRYSWTADNHSTRNYKIIRFENCENIEVTGGKVVGDYATRIAKNAEGGSYTHNHVQSGTAAGTITGANATGIYFVNSKNVYIHHMDISQCYGDGVGAAGNAPNGSENVLIEECTIHDHARNGVTFGIVKTGTVRHCKVYNIGNITTDANMPMSGMDIETSAPDENGIGADGTIIDGCKFYNCGQYGVIASQGSKDTLVRNCEVQDIYVNGNAKNGVNVEGCTVNRFYAKYDSKISNSTVGQVLFGDAAHCNLTAENCIFTGVENQAAIFGRSPSGTYHSATFKGCEFTNADQGTKGVFQFNSTYTKNISFLDCIFNLYNDLKDMSNQSGAGDTLHIDGCKFIAHRETYTLSAFSFMRCYAPNIVLTNNVLDLSKLKSFACIGLINCSGDNATIAGNTAIYTADGTTFSKPLFKTSSVKSRLYVANNVAPSFSKIADLTTNAETLLKLVYVFHNNLDSATK